jgi:hypothetical protein
VIAILIKYIIKIGMHVAAAQAMVISYRIAIAFVRIVNAGS